MASNIVVSRPNRRAGSERPVVITWLTALALLCWTGVVFYNVAAQGPPAAATLDQMLSPAPPVAPYLAHDLALAFGMWTVVTWAMMLPGSTPVVLVFARVNLLHHTVRRPWLATALFVAGYLVTWSLFGVLAALAQWALHDAGALDAGLAVTSHTVAGLALVAAGVYQWTPAKHACLHHCRAPLAFVLTGWEPGAWGAFQMGATHGTHCVGACWLLVLLLFAAGALNLPALAVLAALVLAEKLLPRGVWVACIAGLALVAWGTLMLFP
jgi:predicted metal-binding membrane protein